MKTFGGPVLFLDRDDINTDELIPAKYLNEDSKAALGPYCLEDLELPGFDRDRDLPGKRAIVTRSNFGCGSSREHAPWALEANGIDIVVAEEFARIFRQNMFNCGMIAAELPRTVIDEIFSRFSGVEATMEVDVDKGELKISSKESGALTAPLSLDPFQLAMVKAGGWVAFAATRY